MLDFVPELVDGGVVVNAVNCTPNHGADCRFCQELSIGIHNWLLLNEMRYLVIDFQDENDICTTIITELLQLRKRFRIPFLFAGLMAKSRNVLDSYAYTGYPYFITPEEAIAYLRQHHPGVVDREYPHVRFGEIIPCTNARHARNDDTDVVEDVVEADI